MHWPNNRNRRYSRRGAIFKRGCGSQNHKEHDDPGQHTSIEETKGKKQASEQASEHRSLTRNGAVNLSRFWLAIIFYWCTVNGGRDRTRNGQRIVRVARRGLEKKQKDSRTVLFISGAGATLLSADERIWESTLLEARDIRGEGGCNRVRRELKAEKMKRTTEDKEEPINTFVTAVYILNPTAANLRF